MSLAIDIETNAIFCGITQFHDVGSLEIDNLGRQILARRLTIAQGEPQDVIKTCLESLDEVIDFARRLLLLVLPTLHLRSFFPAINRDRLVLRRAELGTFHIREFDVVGEQVATAEFTSSKREEASGGVNVFNVEKRLTT